MRRWVGLGLIFALLGCGASQNPAVDPAEVRREKEVEIARLQEQVKSYDLLNDITADPGAAADPEREKKRAEIHARLAELRR